MFGRLFKGFEQGVKRTCREHMHLVDDIHPVLAADRSKVCLVTDVSDVVNAVVRRSVNLNDIHYGSAVYTLAGFAFAARVSVYGVLTVDGLCKNLCTGRLTCSA